MAEGSAESRSNNPDLVGGSFHGVTGLAFYRTMYDHVGSAKGDYGSLSTFSTETRSWKNPAGLLSKSEEVWLSGGKRNTRFHIGGDDVSNRSLHGRRDVSVYVNESDYRARDGRGEIRHKGVSSPVERGQYQHAKVAVATNKARGETLAGYTTANTSNNAISAKQYNVHRIFSSKHNPEEVRELQAIDAFIHGQSRGGRPTGLKHFDVVGPQGDDALTRERAALAKLGKGDTLYVMSANFDGSVLAPELAAAAKRGAKIHLAANSWNGHGNDTSKQMDAAKRLAGTSSNITVHLTPKNQFEIHANQMVAARADGTVDIIHEGSTRLKWDFFGGQVTDIIYHATGVGPMMQKTLTTIQSAFRRMEALKSEGYFRLGNKHNQFADQFAPGKAQATQMTHRLLIDGRYARGGVHYGMRAIRSLRQQPQTARTQALLAQYEANLAAYQDAPGLATSLYTAIAHEGTANRPGGVPDVIRAWDRQMQTASLGYSGAWLQQYLPDWAGGGFQLGNRGIVDSTLISAVRYWDNRLAARSRYGEQVGPGQSSGLASLVENSFTMVSDIASNTALFFAVSMPLMKFQSYVSGELDEGLRRAVDNSKHYKWGDPKVALRYFEQLNLSQSRMTSETIRGVVKPLLGLFSENPANHAEEVAKIFEGHKGAFNFNQARIKAFDYIDSNILSKNPITWLVSSKGLGGYFNHVANVWNVGQAARGLVDGLKVLHSDFQNRHLIRAVGAHMEALAHGHLFNADVLDNTSLGRAAASRGGDSSQRLLRAMNAATGPQGTLNRTKLVSALAAQDWHIPAQAGVWQGVDDLRTAQAIDELRASGLGPKPYVDAPELRSPLHALKDLSVAEANVIRARHLASFEGIQAVLGDDAFERLSQGLATTEEVEQAMRRVGLHRSGEMLDEFGNPTGRDSGFKRVGTYAYAWERIKTGVSQPFKAGWNAFVGPDGINSPFGKAKAFGIAGLALGLSINWMTGLAGSMDRGSVWTEILGNKTIGDEAEKYGRHRTMVRHTAKFATWGEDWGNAAPLLLKPLAWLAGTTLATLNLPLEAVAAYGANVIQDFREAWKMTTRTMGAGALAQSRAAYEGAEADARCDNGLAEALHFFGRSEVSANETHLSGRYMSAYAIQLSPLPSLFALNLAFNKLGDKTTVGLGIQGPVQIQVGAGFRLPFAFKDNPDGKGWFFGQDVVYDPGNTFEQLAYSTALIAGTREAGKAAYSTTMRGLAHLDNGLGYHARLAVLQMDHGRIGKGPGGFLSLAGKAVGAVETINKTLLMAVPRAIVGMAGSLVSLAGIRGGGLFGYKDYTASLNAALDSVGVDLDFREALTTFHDPLERAEVVRQHLDTMDNNELTKVGRERLVAQAGELRMNAELRAMRAQTPYAFDKLLDTVNAQRGTVFHRMADRLSASAAARTRAYAMADKLSRFTYGSGSRTLTAGKLGRLGAFGLFAGIGLAASALGPEGFMRAAHRTISGAEGTLLEGAVGSVQNFLGLGMKTHPQAFEGRAGIEAGPGDHTVSNNRGIFNGGRMLQTLLTNPFKALLPAFYFGSETAFVGTGSAGFAMDSIDGDTRVGARSFAQLGFPFGGIQGTRSEGIGGATVGADAEWQDATNFNVLGAASQAEMLSARFRRPGKKRAVMGTLFNRNSGLDQLGLSGRTAMKNRQAQAAWVLSNNNAFDVGMYYFFDAKRQRMAFDTFMPSRIGVKEGAFAALQRMLAGPAGKDEALSGAIAQGRSGFEAGGTGEIEFDDEAPLTNAGYQGSDINALRRPGLEMLGHGLSLAALGVGVGITALNWKLKHPGKTFQELLANKEMLKYEGAKLLGHGSGIASLKAVGYDPAGHGVLIHQEGGLADKPLGAPKGIGRAAGFNAYIVMSGSNNRMMSFGGLDFLTGTPDFLRQTAEGSVSRASAAKAAHLMVNGSLDAAMLDALNVLQYDNLNTAGSTPLTLEGSRSTLGARQGAIANLEAQSRAAVLNTQKVIERVDEALGEYHSWNDADFSRNARAQSRQQKLMALKGTLQTRLGALEAVRGHLGSEGRLSAYSQTMGEIEDMLSEWNGRVAEATEVARAAGKPLPNDLDLVNAYAGERVPGAGPTSLLDTLVERARGRGINLGYVPGQTTLTQLTNQLADQQQALINSFTGGSQAEAFVRDLGYTDFESGHFHRIGSTFVRMKEVGMKGLVKLGIDLFGQHMEAEVHAWKEQTRFNRSLKLMMGNATIHEMTSANPAMAEVVKQYQGRMQELLIQGTGETGPMTLYEASELAANQFKEDAAKGLNTGFGVASDDSVKELVTQMQKATSQASAIEFGEARAMAGALARVGFSKVVMPVLNRGLAQAGNFMMLAGAMRATDSLSLYTVAGNSDFSEDEQEAAVRGMALDMRTMLAGAGTQGAIGATMYGTNYAFATRRFMAGSYRYEEPGKTMYRVKGPDGQTPVEVDRHGNVKGREGTYHLTPKPELHEDGTKKFRNLKFGEASRLAASQAATVRPFGANVNVLKSATKGGLLTGAGMAVVGTAVGLASGNAKVGLAAGLQFGGVVGNVMGALAVGALGFTVATAGLAAAAPVAVGLAASIAVGFAATAVFEQFSEPIANWFANDRQFVEDSNRLAQRVSPVLNPLARLGNAAREGWQGLLDQLPGGGAWDFVKGMVGFYQDGGHAQQFRNHGRAAGASLSDDMSRWQMAWNGGAATQAMAITPLYHGTETDATYRRLNEQDAATKGDASGMISHLFNAKTLYGVQDVAFDSHMTTPTNQQGSFMAGSFGSLSTLGDSSQAMMTTRALAAQSYTSGLLNRERIWGKMKGRVQTKDSGIGNHWGHYAEAYQQAGALSFGVVPKTQGIRNVGQSRAQMYGTAGEGLSTSSVTVPLVGNPGLQNKVQEAANSTKGYAHECFAYAWEVARKAGLSGIGKAKQDTALRGQSIEAGLMEGIRSGRIRVGDVIWTNRTPGQAANSKDWEKRHHHWMIYQGGGIFADNIQGGRGRRTAQQMAADSYMAGTFIDRVYHTASEAASPASKAQQPGTTQTSLKARQAAPPGVGAMAAGMVGMLDNLRGEHVGGGVQSGNQAHQPVKTPEVRQPKRDLVSGLAFPLSYQEIGHVLGLGKEATTKNLPLIASALAKHGLTDQRVVLGVLANIKTETSGIQPIDEYNGGKESYYDRYDKHPGLGNKLPGDGRRYHGRGFIQLTGRANYAAYGKQLGIDLINNPNLANNPSIAAEIAALYIKNRGLHHTVNAAGGSFSDGAFYKRMRRGVNGGYHGLDRYQATITALQQAIVAKGQGKNILSFPPIGKGTPTVTVIPTADSQLNAGIKQAVGAIGTAFKNWWEFVTSTTKGALMLTATYLDGSKWTSLYDPYCVGNNDSLIDPYKNFRG